MNLRNSLATLREDPVRSLAMGAALLVVGWLVLYPLVILVAMGMHDKAGNLTFANYVTIVTDPEGGIASIMATRASLSDSTGDAGEESDEGGAPAASSGDSGDGEE